MNTWARPFAIKTVNGFPGYYVDSLGNVYSDHGSGCRNYKGTVKTRKKLTPGVKQKGYLSLVLQNNGKRKTFTVHRLVCDAFVPVVNGKQHINHKDGVKSNNAASNLEWCTPKENIRHSINVLKIDQARGHRFAIESVDIASGNVIKKYDAVSYVNRDGFDYTSVSRVLNGRRTKYRGMYWRKVAP